MQSETIERKGHFDWILFLCILFLLLFSLAVVYSSSAAYAEYKFGEYDIFFRSHLRNVVLAFVAMIISYKIDLEFWKKWANGLLYLSLFLLVVVLFYSNPIKGATRWIDLGWVNFQPSEVAKFALMVFIAKIISERYELKDDFWLVPMPIFFWVFIFCGLIALQPNFSSSLIIFLISITIMIISKVKIKYLINFSLFSIIIGLLYSVTASYRINRIVDFWAFLTSSGKNSIAYQTQQALLALGNGGFWGLGPGKSRQSFLFLPESYGDYIFSIIGEEYGFIGTLFLILIICFVLFRIYKITKNCQDLFMFILSSGILIILATYTIVNAFVNIGLLPSTGLPMPFISYGGSAVIVYGIMIGIILRINKETKSKETI
jgi:cell division protein FtsW